jgi:hypothetical protein
MQLSTANHTSLLKTQPRVSSVDGFDTENIESMSIVGEVVATSVISGPASILQGKP